MIKSQTEKKLVQWGNSNEKNYTVVVMWFAVHPKKAGMVKLLQTWPKNNTNICKRLLKC